MRKIVIQASWDDEARVWVATSEDVPGLVTEADTAEELEKKLCVMVPELLEENGLLEKSSNERIPFQLHSESTKALLASAVGCC
jgi:predicted RNase H-like HicB family nuclease